MSLKAFLPVAAVLATVVPTSAALACTYESAPEPIGRPSGDFIARKMFSEASFVDLAIAEHARPLAASEGRAFAQAVTFRVIQR
jgi:hypothetical protein